MKRLDHPTLVLDATEAERWAVDEAFRRKMTELAGSVARAFACVVAIGHEDGTILATTDGALQ